MKDGIAIPTYPGLGFVSIEEVAQAVARPLALFRRRVNPFAAVHAAEPGAGPLAHALGVALRIPIDANPTGPRLSVGVVGDNPTALRRDGGNFDDWAFCLGLRLPPWRYAGALDGTLIGAEVEVPWATADARARRPEGDVEAALALALLHVECADDAILRHLSWHRSRPHLRAGDPGSTYAW